MIEDNVMIRWPEHSSGRYCVSVYRVYGWDGKGELPAIGERQEFYIGSVRVGDVADLRVGDIITADSPTNRDGYQCRILHEAVPEVLARVHVGYKVYAERIEERSGSSEITTN